MRIDLSRFVAAIALVLCGCGDAYDHISMGPWVERSSAKPGARPYPVQLEVTGGGPPVGASELVEVSVEEIVQSKWDREQRNPPKSGTIWLWTGFVHARQHAADLGKYAFRLALVGVPAGSVLTVVAVPTPSPRPPDFPYYVDGDGFVLPTHAVRGVFKSVEVGGTYRVKILRSCPGTFEVAEGTYRGFGFSAALKGDFLPSGVDWSFVRSLPVTAERIRGRCSNGEEPRFANVRVSETANFHTSFASRAKAGRELQKRLE